MDQDQVWKIPQTPFAFTFRFYKDTPIAIFAAFLHLQALRFILLALRLLSHVEVETADTKIS